MSVSSIGNAAALSSSATSAAAVTPVVDPPTLLQSLQSFALNPTQTETTLHSWESSKYPGYMLSLLSVIGGATEGVTPDIRLLSSILVKNAVTRVWSWKQKDENDDDDDNHNQDDDDNTNISHAEKIQLKAARESERNEIKLRLPHILFGETDERIALHLRLTLANISAFDFPTAWPSLLNDLCAVASSSENTHQLRAVKTIKDVLQTSYNRKVILKGPTIGKNDLRSLLALSSSIIKNSKKQKEITRNACVPIFGSLCAGGIQFATLFFQSRGEFEGKMCAAFLKAVEKLLPMTSSAAYDDSYSSTTNSTMKGDISTFLGQITALVGELKHYHPPTSTEMELSVRLADKIYRAALSCIVTSIDCCTLEFAAHLPICLQTVLDGMFSNGEAPVDTSSMPIKRLVLQTKFVTKILSCPLFDLEKMKLRNQRRPMAKLVLSAGGPMLVPMGGGNGEGNGGKADENKQQEDPNLTAARQAIETLLSTGSCQQLVEAIVTKFLRLTEAEAIEWDTDPEGRFQTADVERTMGDIETPRRCGGILLMNMAGRNKECGKQVCAALLDLARRYQAQNQQDLNLLIYREACYFGLELCRRWMMEEKQLSFPDWWDGELRGLLQTTLPASPPTPVPMRALQARVIQVVHAYAECIREHDFPVAFSIMTELLHSPDVVTALFAARCLNKLALMHVQGTDVSPQLAAVRERSTPALGNAFALADRVTDEECLSVVLRLVSGLIEANGTSLEPCLHAIAERLPPLWERAGDTDGTAIHSSLIAVLDHLIMKIGYTAVENEHIQKILFPLLDYCTDVSVPHRVDTVLEDGLKLWLVTLVTSRMATMGNPLTAMLPRLEAVIRNGSEPHLSLKVLHFYTVLMGSNVVEPLAEPLGKLLMECTSFMTTEQEEGEEEEKDAEMMEDEATMMNPHPNNTGRPGQKKGPHSIAAATLRDGMGAMSFMDTLLQLFPALGCNLCYPTLSKVLTSMDKRPLPMPLLEATFVALGRMLWSRPSALEEIFAEDDEKIIRIVHTWLRIVPGPPPFLGAIAPRLSTVIFIKQKGTALSLCSAVCRSPRLARLIGKSVVQFTTSVLEMEESMKLDINAIVEASCGTTRQVVGDGPLGDSQSRTAEILKADPLITVSLKEAVESASNVMKDIPS